MNNQRICATTPAPSSRAPALLLAGAVVAALVGCATDPSASKAPPPKNCIAEYRQIAANSLSAMKAALASLDQVNAQTNSCPRPVFDALATEVRRLEVDSLKARSHAQAMLARGDAYFEEWHDHLTHVKDAEARALAEQRRPLLQQSFARIKQLSQQTREAFRPFESDLRKLRNILETDPAAVGSESTKDLIQTARGNGQQVERDLAAILDELNTAAALVKPLKTAAKNGYENH